jgi:hypothetical protein
MYMYINDDEMNRGLKLEQTENQQKTEVMHMFTVTSPTLQQGGEE